MEFSSNILILMAEITFSLMGTEAEVQSIKPWIEEFERRTRVRVKIIALEWVGGWDKIVKMALSGQGPDISEIGTTWTASLASMNVLRPYSEQDIQSLGGKNAFLDSSWKSCTMPGDMQTWAVPWLSDVHLLFYRGEVLEKDHISPQFDSPSGLESTLKALQQTGHPAPLSITTSQEPNLMHDAASWIWSEGGQFLTDDGSKVMFDQPEALRGFFKYFSMRQFLASGYHNNQGSWQKFLKGESLVAFGTPAHYLQAQHNQPEDVKTWGAASVVGSSFVGGTNLVVWKNSRQASAALDLMRFLEEKATGYPASPHSFHTPCRIATLNQLEENDNAVICEMVKAIKTGHSYKITRLWGLVEKGLISQLGGLWQILLDDPAIDIETTVNEALTSLARRLNIALSG